MKHHWITIAALLVMLRSASVAAQAPDNMVFNPSFEEYSYCPQHVHAVGIMTGVDAWWQPTKGSSDYFNACSKHDSGVPRNKMGYQTAHDGLAYCGIYCSQENYREYLQTELKQPLAAGQRYRVSFWVSLADKSPHAVASIGALFTDEMIGDTTSWDIIMEREDTAIDEQQSMSIATYREPQVVNSPDSTLTNSKMWQEISGEFVAQGGERFLTIGNFAPFNHSGVVPVESTNAILPGAYYYIDDVNVVAIGASQPKPKTEEATIPIVDEIKILRGIYFATGKSDILPQSYNELQHLLEHLRTNPDLRIELRGHTDNQGTAGFNMQLSLARAEAVAQYLINRGIDASRIQTQGFGKSMPVDSNDTPEGRSHNRRVEYRVLAN